MAPMSVWFMEVKNPKPTAVMTTTCTGKPIRADVLAAAVFDALIAFYADPDVIQRAIVLKTQQVATITCQHPDEIDATAAELRKTEAAIERYILAFEAGTVSDDMFGPRVHDLGDRARTLKARRDELAMNSKKPHTSPPPWTCPPKRTSTRYVAELEEIIKSGSDARRKAAAQAFVDRLVVQAPGVIQPTYFIRGGLPTNTADNPVKPPP